MSRTLFIRVLIGFILIIGQISPVTGTPINPLHSDEPKQSAAAGKPGIVNIILMVPDGMATAHLTLGRWHRFAKTGKNRLALDELACGLIRTYSSDATVTDSAPSASAMATGYKTVNRSISVFPDMILLPDVPSAPAGRSGYPAPTLLEAARSLGKATGLVVTCPFSHATPAAFSAHYPDRNRAEILSEQQVYQGIDVLLGGGRQDLDPKKRPDQENLISVLRDQGRMIVQDRTAMLAADSGPLWGIFADKGMNLAIDRDSVNEPSLAEMTAKALQLLSQNPKGFFLMVEGSQIDWVAHDNDGAAVAAEVDAFDEAVAVALAFARNRSDTVLVIAPDHSTGGLMISQEPVVPFSSLIDHLQNSHMSALKACEQLSDLGGIEAIGAYLAREMGIESLTPEEKRDIEQNINRPKSLTILIGQISSRRMGIGWSTTHHSGEDVPLFIHHPRGIRLQGIVQNHEIGRYLAGLLPVDLDRLGAQLFLPALDAFARLGAAVTIDGTVPANPVLVVKKGSKTIRFPVNQNIAYLADRPVQLEGIVVCLDLPAKGIPGTASWYVPAGALTLLD